MNVLVECMINVRCGCVLDDGIRYNVGTLIIGTYIMPLDSIIRIDFMSLHTIIEMGTISVH